MMVYAVDESHAEDLNGLLGTNRRLQGGAFSSLRSIRFALPFGVRYGGRRGVPLGEFSQPVTQASAPTEWPAVWARLRSARVLLSRTHGTIRSAQISADDSFAEVAEDSEMGAGVGQALALPSLPSLRRLTWSAPVVDALPPDFPLLCMLEFCLVGHSSGIMTWYVGGLVHALKYIHALPPLVELSHAGGLDAPMLRYLTLPGGATRPARGNSPLQSRPTRAGRRSRRQPSWPGCES